MDDPSSQTIQAVINLDVKMPTPNDYIYLEQRRYCRQRATYRWHAFVFHWVVKSTQEIAGLNHRRGSAFRLINGVNVSSNNMPSSCFLLQRTAESEMMIFGTYSIVQDRCETILKGLDQIPHDVWAERLLKRLRWTRPCLWVMVEES